MKDVFIVDAIRTPIGKFGGTLSPIRPDDMAAHVIAELLKRNASLDPTRVEDVVFGCANQAGEDNRNVARMALLLAGMPASVPGETVNRLCASGLSAAVRVAREIQVGAGDVFLAGGVESMTRAPFVVGKNAAPFGRMAEMYDTSIGWRFVNKKLDKAFGTHSMGETAEEVATQFEISREDQDAFACWSQQKAGAAQEKGRFEQEIVAVEIPQRKSDPIQFSKDEFPRPTTTVEKLSGLRAAFRSPGTVTAGNASGINDGACALLLCSEDAVKEYSLTPKARLVDATAAGVEPRIMGIGPVDATKRLLERTGISLDDIGVIELNEAFAAQSLACTRSLGLDDNDSRVNPNGGAIALGHPLGMTGARLLQTAMCELHERSEKYALCTMCVGVGQGMAAIIERV